MKVYMLHSQLDVRLLGLVMAERDVFAICGVLLV